MTNIFVGNLSYQTAEEELRTLFEAYGAVEAVQNFDRPGHWSASRLRIRGNGESKRSGNGYFRVKWAHFERPRVERQ